MVCDAPAGARARRTNGDGGEGGGEDGGDDGGEGGGEGPPLVAGLAGTATQRTATEAAEEGASWDALTAPSATSICVHAGRA